MSTLASGLSCKTSEDRRALRRAKSAFGCDELDGAGSRPMPCCWSSQVGGPFQHRCFCSLFIVGVRSSNQREGEQRRKRRYLHVSLILPSLLASCALCRNHAKVVWFAIQAMLKSGCHKVACFIKSSGSSSLAILPSALGCPL